MIIDSYLWLVSHGTICYYFLILDNTLMFCLKRYKEIRGDERKRQKNKGKNINFMNT